MTFYPGGVTQSFGADFSLFDEFSRARGTGVYDPLYMGDVWLPKFAKDCQLHNSAQCANCSASCRPTLEGLNATIERMAMNFFRPQPDNVLVIPYTNAQGLVWDFDAQQFLDEWSMFDIADPRWATWNRCWKDGRFGLPCPNETYGWQQHAHRSMVPVLDRNWSLGWPSGTNAGASQYYRDAHSSSRIDEALHYTKIMLEKFADGIYCKTVMLSRFVALPVSLTSKHRPLQTTTCTCTRTTFRSRWAPATSERMARCVRACLCSAGASSCGGRP